MAGVALGAGLGGAFIGGLTAACVLAALGALTLERRLPVRIDLPAAPDRLTSTAEL